MSFGIDIITIFNPKKEVEEVELTREIINEYDRAKQIMDNYKTGLIFPFHINHELRQSVYFYNKDYTEFHEHDFYSIILRVSEDPKAFYLTDKDKEYYSKQELEVIEKIKK